MSDLALAIERRIDRVLGPLLIALLAPFAPAGPRRDPPPPRRVLLLKLHGIGNLVLLLPVIRQVRRAFPEARVGFLTFRSNADLLAGWTEVDECHFLDRGRPWRLATSLLRAVASLRRNHYDLVIDFDQFAHLSGVLTLASGAPRRVGFRNPSLRRHLAYTDPVPLLDASHVQHTFARLAEAAGAPSSPPPPRELKLSNDHLREAAGLLDDDGITPEQAVVVLHPGSSDNLVLRRWPAERFARLGGLLVRELGARVVLSGVKDEEALAHSVREMMDHRATVAAGRLSLPGFAALCRRALLVVSNDTAAVHVASAMGTPVCGLYGPNTPFLYGPLGGRDLVFYAEISCSPCLSNLTSKLSHCRRARCMEAIGVEEVFSAIRARFFSGKEGKGT